MSSNLPRLAVRQATTIKNNPYMSARETSDDSKAQNNDRVTPTNTVKNGPEPVPVEKEGFSIAKFFGLRSLDQALIQNVRRLVEEERDRQMEFERMHHPNLNY
ncbi:unnamed protein product [Cylicocyclus nassatus]|uniref:Uncharacterized protein n=1 Tax=Cylicocyclus nassatus TaxID=53992 RepID=A0AA36MDV1_CYLNA|nr:unnamed protein product [Cylicocyclus nassatus]